MRVPYILGVTAASFVMLSSAANAQSMERRDLLDPFGVWSGGYSGSQQQIFAPGPPSKTGAHFGPRYTNDSYGYNDRSMGYYEESMPGRRWR